MILIDSHVHLDDPRFDDDRDDVVKRALKAGISHMIVPAVTAARWAITKQVTDTFETVSPAYGLHPYFIDEHEIEHLDQLQTWIQQEQPIAVGECGLDFFLPELDQQKQKIFFEAQLQIAKECDLPIIIHARGAVEEVINTIKRSGHRNGMIHSFNGSQQQAEKLIELGYLLSFGATVTFPRAKKLRNLITTLPLQHLLIETDAPDQAGIKHHKQRNEPCFLIDVVSTFAELRQESQEQIALQTTENAQRLFHI